MPKMIAQHRIKNGVLLFSMFALPLCASVAQGGSRRGPVHEQREFSAEDSGVRNPVSIPAVVLAALRGDQTVQDVLASEGKSVTDLPDSWFSASFVHLGKGGELGLVVAGEPPVVGGNLSIFWIFMAAPHGYDLVLKVSAHDLAVLDSFRNGYRVIETQGETASHVYRTQYRLDGGRYISFRKAQQPIKH